MRKKYLKLEKRGNIRAFITITWILIKKNNGFWRFLCREVYSKNSDQDPWVLFLWWTTVELTSFALKVWPPLFSNSHVITKLWQSWIWLVTESRFLLISDLPKQWLDSCLNSLQIYELYSQLFPQCGFDVNNSEIQSLSSSLVIDLIFHRRISWIYRWDLDFVFKIFISQSFLYQCPTKKRKQIVAFLQLLIA